MIANNGTSFTLNNIIIEDTDTIYARSFGTVAVAGGNGGGSGGGGSLPTYSIINYNQTTSGAITADLLPTNTPGTLNAPIINNTAYPMYVHYDLYGVFESYTESFSVSTEWVLQLFEVVWFVVAGSTGMIESKSVSFECIHASDVLASNYLPGEIVRGKGTLVVLPGQYFYHYYHHGIDYASLPKMTIYSLKISVEKTP
jgi:hypothetical protein